MITIRSARLLIFSICIFTPSLVTSTYTMSTTDHVQFPDNRHTSTKSSSGLKSAAPDIYDSVKKNRMGDIFCTGDEVSIDEPIHSNSGDIVIYARKLRIAKPLDTRVYFDRIKFVLDKPFQSGYCSLHCNLEISFLKPARLYKSLWS